MGPFLPGIAQLKISEGRCPRKRRSEVNVGQSSLAGGESEGVLGPSLRSGPQSPAKDASVGGLRSWMHFAPVDPVSRKLSRISSPKQHAAHPLCPRY